MKEKNDLDVVMESDAEHPAKVNEGKQGQDAQIQQQSPGMNPIKKDVNAFVLETPPPKKDLKEMLKQRKEERESKSELESTQKRQKTGLGETQDKVVELPKVSQNVQVQTQMQTTSMTPQPNVQSLVMD